PWPLDSMDGGLRKRVREFMIKFFRFEPGSEFAVVQNIDRTDPVEGDDALGAQGDLVQASERFLIRSSETLQPVIGAFGQRIGRRTVKLEAELPSDRETGSVVRMVAMSERVGGSVGCQVDRARAGYAFAYATHQRQFVARKIVGHAA